MLWPWTIKPLIVKLMLIYCRLQCDFFFPLALTQNSQVSPLSLVPFPVNGIRHGLRQLRSCLESQNFPLQQHSKLPFIFNCSPPCRPIKDEASRAKITGKAFEGSRPSICFAGRLPFTHLCKNANNWTHSVGSSAIQFSLNHFLVQMAVRVAAPLNIILGVRNFRNEISIRDPPHFSRKHLLKQLQEMPLISSFCLSLGFPSHPSSAGLRT